MIESMSMKPELHVGPLWQQGSRYNWVYNAVSIVDGEVSFFERPEKTWEVTKKEATKWRREHVKIARRNGWLASVNDSTLAWIRRLRELGLKHKKVVFFKEVMAYEEPNSSPTFLSEADFKAIKAHVPVRYRKGWTPPLSEWEKKFLGHIEAARASGYEPDPELYKEPW
jgi:hypothetical protein